MNLSDPMQNLLAIAPVVVPWTAAAVEIVINRSLRLQRAISFLALSILLVVGLLLTDIVVPAAVFSTVLGARESLLGIAITVEPLGAALIVATAALAAVAMATSAVSGEDQHRYFHPLALVLVGGACGSFVTGDLFNLFVLVEVVLTVSYALLSLPGGSTSLRDTALYVAVNLVGTLLLLAGIGAVLGAAGTVNLAILSGLSLDAEGLLPGAVLVMAALALKSALVPLTGWLVVGYPAASRTLMALFAGIMTTVGITAVYRVGLLAFQGHETLRLGILTAAILTTVVAALAATAAAGGARVMGFVIATQVGFMALGFGLGTRVAVTAGVFFILQDVVIKTGAVLSLHVLERNLAPRRFAGGLFAVLGLSLAGFPVTAGFVGKSLLVQASLMANTPVAALAALLASVFTLAALLRLWSGWMWRGEAADPGGGLGWVGPAAMAAAAVAVGVVPGWLLEVAQAAARVLTDPELYTTEVLRR